MSHGIAFMNAKYLSALSRVLAEKQIRLPRTRLSRWVSLICELNEDDLAIENEVLIRLAKKDDLEFFANSEDIADPENGLLRQDIKFWDEYGFRCLYVGFIKEETHPFCLCYFIDHSENHRFEKMEYGSMYEPLTSNMVHVEGAYVRKNMRGKKLFLKFCQKRNKLFYQKGKKLVRSHVLLDKSRVPMLIISKKVGFVPDHLISSVTINLPIFRTRVFVHHPIRDSDRGKFPLTLFDRGNE
jgi:hypothetical protein